MTLAEAKEVIRRAVDHPDELVMPSVLREAGAVLLMALKVGYSPSASIPRFGDDMGSYGR